MQILGKLRVIKVFVAAQNGSIGLKENQRFAGDRIVEFFGVFSIVASDAATKTFITLSLPRICTSN
ncbi:MAG: hypothetical protein AAFQ68_22975, partial [Bacteroidota bacterium]